MWLWAWSRLGGALYICCFILFCFVDWLGFPWWHVVRAVGVISVSFNHWEKVWATENRRCGGPDGERCCTLWGRSGGWVGGGVASSLLACQLFSCYALDRFFFQGGWRSRGGLSWIAVATFGRRVVDLRDRGGGLNWFCFRACVLSYAVVLFNAYG